MWYPISDYGGTIIIRYLINIFHRLRIAVSKIYSTIETNEAVRIGHSGFLFQPDYSGEGQGAQKEICYQINICAIPLFRWNILSYDHIYELWVTYMFSWFFACLSGARVVHIVHVVNLYDVISCNVRYHFCVKTTFFCRGFMFFIDVICIVLRILVSNTISIVSVLFHTPMPPVVVLVNTWKCLDHAEGTNSKSEVTQTNISTNMEITEQKL
jgi:hypothetical protein